MGTHLWSLKSNLQIKNTLKWSKESPIDADWLGTPRLISVEFPKPPAASSYSSTPANEVLSLNVVTLAKLSKASKLTGPLSSNQVGLPDGLKPFQGPMEVASPLNL